MKKRIQKMREIKDIETELVLGVPELVLKSEAIVLTNDRKTGVYDINNSVFAFPN